MLSPNIDFYAPACDCLAKLSLPCVWCNKPSQPSVRERLTAAICGLYDHFNVSVTLHENMIASAVAESTKSLSMSWRFSPPVTWAKLFMYPMLPFMLSTELEINKPPASRYVQSTRRSRIGERHDECQRITEWAALISNIVCRNHSTRTLVSPGTEIQSK